MKGFVWRCLVRTVAVGLVFAFAAGVRAATPWFPFGPDGGDARAFATDPHDHTHIYLGTEASWIYESHDSGKSWKRLAHLSDHDDLVLDNIVVDPSTPNRILVGAWYVTRPSGGLFVSSDGGHTWSENAAMKGKSIRALVQAGSDPKILVAGALDGVYRTKDGGTEWTLISPAGSKEIHEVESVAIDPKDPDKLFAGTWHLPWKSTDGGANWTTMKQGIIDDSDVFSIIIDRNVSTTMFASACSGIYKSVNAGESYAKVQGIPSTARRTRVLMQDPGNPQVVYAGTTEGLWRTSDGGTKWIRTTGTDVIVNDVYVDPTASNHVLLATDHGGVLMSDDAGTSFQASNKGFSARQVESYVADRSNPLKLYVGVINDKSLGGVFASEDGGVTWSQRSQGLLGRDILSLAQAPDGTILAGTTHGFARLNGDVWQPATTVQQPASPDKEITSKVKRGKKVITSTKTIKGKSSAPYTFSGVVYSMATSGENIYAATGDGLLVSRNSAATWEKLEVVAGSDWRQVAAAKDSVLVASRSAVAISLDKGATWQSREAPSGLTHMTTAAVDEIGHFWVGGREGVSISTTGTDWKPAAMLPVTGVTNIYSDIANQRVIVTADSAAPLLFTMHIPDMRVQVINAGWRLRFARSVGDHLIGATYFDGIVVEPKMVDSQEKSAVQASTVQ